ncbi:MAG: type II toxin-antitoxin system Phd/YefM family antitoxin [Pleurocapsa sp. SU_196_0]|nr:type II toxin-antitoxin system Phd/YefM family antitoxin [Pleurocapsa sp. SU_196_0]
MMRQVNVFEAKTHFSKLLERVEAGEEIIVARSGKPVARLVKLESATPTKRKPGRLKGRIKGAASLLEPDVELETAFSADTSSRKPNEVFVGHTHPAVVAGR